ncbi:hypothetical protein ARMGADRAFT_1022662 [Armillaria gallica]|uniref:F-box domain-containing protein n=1 Tax=Armillaria gallica TaxID=47427 RepID=A0A2H3ENT0_ARMGA|nr:hypothetical protein ARMGADRAFT_1022662 [Armillaria gallica]
MADGNLQCRVHMQTYMFDNEGLEVLGLLFINLKLLDGDTHISLWFEPFSDRLIEIIEIRTCIYVCMIGNRIWLIVKKKEDTFKFSVAYVVDMEKETSKSIGVGDKSFDNLLLDLLSAPLQFPRTISTAKLLASNAAPSEAQYMYFQSVVERGQEDMQKLSQRLIRARAIVDYLDGQLELAITNVEDAQTIMHPMWRVNDDVLGMIFQYCAETESSRNSINVREMPWTLSHVCGRWRSLVMNTGRLWTRVRLDLGHDEAFMGSVGASYLISSQLLRAAPFKVDMMIEGYPGDSMVNSVFPVLIPFSPQIRSLKIKASPSACRFLSSLSIHGASYHSESLETNDMYQDLTLDAFTFAPNLECLRIFLERTVQMGRLEMLDLICNCDIDDIDDDPDPVTIPSLHQLVLHDPENWQTILIVWDKIFASQEPSFLPNLHEFFFGYEGGLNADDDTDIIEALCNQIVGSAVYYAPGWIIHPTAGLRM